MRIGGSIPLRRFYQVSARTPHSLPFRCLRPDIERHHSVHTDQQNVGATVWRGQPKLCHPHREIHTTSTPAMSGFEQTRRAALHAGRGRERPRGSTLGLSAQKAQGAHLTAQEVLM